MKLFKIVLLALLPCTVLAQDRTHTSKGETLKYVNGQYVWVAPHVDYKGELVYGAVSNSPVMQPKETNEYKPVRVYDAECKCYKVYMVSKKQ